MEASPFAESESGGGGRGSTEEGDEEHDKSGESGNVSSSRRADWDNAANGANVGSSIFSRTDLNGGVSASIFKRNFWGNEAGK